MKQTGMAGIVWVLIGLAQSVGAQQDAWQLSQEAREAYQLGNLRGYVRLSEAAAEALPTHMGFRYRLARAYAGTGNRMGMYDALKQIAASGLYMPLTQDTAFARYMTEAECKAVVAQMQRNREQHGRLRSEVALRLPQPVPLLAEGLAYDAQRQDWYVGGVRPRMLLRIPRGKAAKVEVAAQLPDLYGVMGLYLDAAHKELWAATAALPASGIDSTLLGNAALEVFQLKTGKRLRRHMAPPMEDGRAVVLGDVCVATDGWVYATNSTGNEVYRVQRDAPEELSLQPWLHVRGARSLQGLTQLGNHLIVADYSTGLHWIDLRMGTHGRLEVAEGICLTGIDGLYAWQGQLIAIQNGTDPQRIVRLTLAPDAMRVVRLEVLEQNTPGWGEPTLGCVVGNAFYYYGNSQWSRVRADGTAEPEAAWQAVEIRRLELKAR